MHLPPPAAYTGLDGAARKEAAFMRLSEIPPKYLWGGLACIGLGAALLVPGGVLALAAGIALGYYGRPWLEQLLNLFGKEVTAG